MQVQVQVQEREQGLTRTRTTTTTSTTTTTTTTTSTSTRTRTRRTSQRKKRKETERNGKRKLKIRVSKFFNYKCCSASIMIFYAQTWVSSWPHLLKHLSSSFSAMFSGLTATIKFRRRTMYYLFQMYIPSGCLVALSWVSFWISHEAVPARVALSITTVLTISYMRGSVNINMPRVSYLKSIDYFFLGSFVFIFMTLVEYVLVLKKSRKRTYDPDSKKTGDDIPLELIEKWVGGLLEN